MIDFIKIFANILSFIFFTAVIIKYLPSLFEIDEKPETESKTIKIFSFIKYQITIEKEKK